MKAQKLIDIVSKGEVDQAICLLKKAIDKHRLGKNLYNEVILLNSRLNQIKSEARIGIVARDKLRLEINQIEYGFLELVDVCDEGLKKKILFL